MSKNRDPRVNSIIELLGQITEDDSLHNFSDLCDPSTVQSSFNYLWKLYNTPEIATVLTFKEGLKQAKNRSFNTWVNREGLINTKNKIHCSVCNGDCNLFIQIDTSDPIFQDVKKVIVQIYCCDEGHEFTVLSSTEARDLDSKESKTTYFIDKMEKIVDNPRTHLNILVPDKSKCVDCPAGGPMKIKEKALAPDNRSKIGGYNPKRNFKLHEKVNINKVKLYDDRESVILWKQTPLSCECFNPLVGNIVLHLNYIDLPCFNDKSISGIKILSCKECSTLNVLIFTQSLNLDYPSVIFDVDDYFYHVLRSQDYMNGVVISIDKTKSDIKAICQIPDFDYKTQDDIIFGKAKSFSEKQLEYLENAAILLGTSYARFKRFIKEYFVLDLAKDGRITNKYGEHFSLVHNNNILKGCLIEQRGDEVIIHGKPNISSDETSLEPLSNEQEDVAVSLGLTVEDSLFV
jgi:hypothetical protein